ncbi:hypothetical protein [Paenibacillus sp. FSL R7-0333]|uniref:hypothetical protein n=1 Tax=Paenibacillus sp. FSL R7-0333 TaxID=1926587 RepID=UPI00096C02B5|nr:hypothetical protein BK146_16760 [Paenibacillus sp. FSL R7-0333]
MNIVEMYDKVKALHSELSEKYYFVGLRFENKEYQVGEECEWSKSNVDREDEREFPDFGTEEYEEMESMGGTSAWDMAATAIYKIGSRENLEDDCKNHFETEHCYIIAGNRKASDIETPWDDNEIVIQDAVVVAQIF